MSTHCKARAGSWHLFSHLILLEVLCCPLTSWCLNVSWSVSGNDIPSRFWWVLRELVWGKVGQLTISPACKTCHLSVTPLRQFFKTSACRSTDTVLWISFIETLQFLPYSTSSRIVETHRRQPIGTNSPLYLMKLFHAGPGIGFQKN